MSKNFAGLAPGLKSERGGEGVERKGGEEGEGGEWKGGLGNNSEREPPKANSWLRT